MQLCGDLGLDTFATVDTLKERTKCCAHYATPFTAEHAPFLIELFTPSQASLGHVRQLGRRGMTQ